MSREVEDAITAVCVMIRKAAAAHRDPSDPYPTSGTYAAATFAEELADDIALGEWRKYLRPAVPVLPACTCVKVANGTDATGCFVHDARRDRPTHPTATEKGK